MAKSDLIELEGTVVDIHPGGKFTVEVERDGQDENIQMFCHAGGKLRKNFINILRGDRVTINVSPYDLTKGIIVWRHK